ncbi:uncharacterized protein LOC110463239 [Mizuhopecten yessoensis]|uniref:Uncharacterized protein n=1 Tax=Mizuhopecten yessoensis TaxID=6573 RepID=A0A210PWL8_MIZYE|nr:uncharacterized protein LOC110463239 [Mizuhopecten yessoensis]OWF40880.1 hypothetical protein KP79_PYT20233 [Mizuhopecten yessoensis]
MMQTRWSTKTWFLLFVCLNSLCIFIYVHFIHKCPQPIKTSLQTPKITCPTSKCPPPQNKLKPIYVCIEDPELLKETGLEKVEFLPFNGATPKDCPRNVLLKETRLNVDEQSRFKECVKNYEPDCKAAHAKFWSGDNQYIRHRHHTYLTSQSLIIDVGGNVGEDAEYLIKHHNPKHYVMLEPLKLLFRNLVKKFENRRNVVMYNFGLAKKNDVFMVSIEGNDGDATSPFLAKTTDGTCSLKVVNTTVFLTTLGVGCYDVDLLTINCEGCEYDVLESILATSLINSFKHIQFATHTKLASLVDPVNRYCRIQELLKRTHRISYSYKFNWETWTRLNVSV